MSYENLVFEKKGHVALITINHPPANAWNLGTAKDFEDAVIRVEENKDLRVVVLTGAGEKCFSAGFDVSDPVNGPEASKICRRLWTRIDRLRKPTIAAINGHALGGGLELALCCHFRYMADNPRARLGLTELNLGIIPGWGGTQRLMRVVGKSRALDMIMFSRRLTARDALDIGLVNQVCSPETLIDETMALAEALAKRPPLAVGYVLEAMAAGQYEGIGRGLEVEEEASMSLRGSQDAKEGFQAFLEKREPVFTGE